LAKLYRNSIALVYPSLYEGFGIPLVEVMVWHGGRCLKRFKPAGSSGRRGLVV
jgi:glycosyltransferase involved in cell wall biosynthesis